MSIKDLFNKGKSFKFSSLKSLDEAGREVNESGEYVEEYIKQRNRFIPRVDFSKFENFVSYGSAEKYAEDAIKRIYQTYPYDGSQREKVEWHNSSILEKMGMPSSLPAIGRSTALLLLVGVDLPLERLTLSKLKVDLARDI